jgi:protease IV
MKSNMLEKSAMDDGMQSPGSHVQPQVQSQPQPMSRSQVEKNGSGRKKTNKGCWILASIGCFLTIIMMAVLVGFFVMVLAADWDSGSVSENVLYEGGDGKIAVIRVSGVITESTSSGGLIAVDGTSADSINNQLDKALYDDSVEGVLIRMNSPGGEVVASDLVYQKVREVRMEKPVVTWMSGMGASGGYMIAAGSDAIFAHPATFTGSIGVIMEVTNLEGLYEKIGIESRIFKSGEFKDSEGVFDDDPDGEADQILQQLIDESYEDFVAAIVDSRGMDAAKVRELADGRIYSGSQAAANGLVDDVGYMDDAIAELETRIGSHDLSIVEYTSGGFWSSFYEYQRIIIDKLGLIPSNNSIGVVQYYLLDI